MMTSVCCKWSCTLCNALLTRSSDTCLENCADGATRRRVVPAFVQPSFHPAHHWVRSSHGSWLERLLFSIRAGLLTMSRNAARDSDRQGPLGVLYPVRFGGNWQVCEHCECSFQEVVSPVKGCGTHRETRGAWVSRGSTVAPLPTLKNFTATKTFFSPRERPAAERHLASDVAPTARRTQDHALLANRDPPPTEGHKKLS